MTAEVSQQNVKTTNILGEREQKKKKQQAHKRSNGFTQYNKTDC